MKLITDIDHLIEEIQEGNTDYFVSVSPIIKSSKSITYDIENEEMSIFHEISEVEEILPKESLEDSSINFYILENKLYMY